MKRKHGFIGCAALCGLIVLIVLVVLGVVGTCIFSHPWHECAIPVPPEYGTVVFMQKGIHPFLAEYEYKVSFEQNGRKMARHLPINVGGRTLMNVYTYPTNSFGGPWLRLQDHWGEYLVDLAAKRTYHVVRYEGSAFAGEVSSARGGWSGTKSDDGMVEVEIDDHPASDITGTPLANEPGEYLGCLDGQAYPLRFVAKSESPEQTITMIK